MSAHTPGPWEVGYYDRNEQLVIEGPDDAEGAIATCWHHSVRSLEEQMHANAHLIAAAPDLLALVEEAIGLFGPPAQAPALWTARALTAVAKARGATMPRTGSERSGGQR